MQDEKLQWERALQKEAADEALAAQKFQNNIDKLKLQNELIQEKINGEVTATHHYQYPHTLAPPQVSDHYSLSLALLSLVLSTGGEAARVP